ncbi:MAG: VOC family protein [Phycisphaerales bacterium]|nr:VOC family protein [Phycisphaerales bacterium]
MINGLHTMIYAKDAAKARAFFRDVLGIRAIDAGEGWLIFAMPPAEMGVHPAESVEDEAKQQIYLMCDDVHATVAQLTAKGVELSQPITDQGWGLMTSLKIPGGGEIALYEPRHPRAH